MSKTDLIITLLFEANDLGVRAETVPCGAVVDGLEVSRNDVAHSEGGDDAFLCAHGLHGITARCS